MDLNVECEHIAIETRPTMIVFYCKKPTYVYLEDTACTIPEGED